MTIGKMHIFIKMHSVKYFIWLIHAKCLFYEQHWANTPSSRKILVRNQGW